MSPLEDRNKLLEIATVRIGRGGLIALPGLESSSDE